MAQSDRFVAAGWLVYATYYIGRVSLAAAKPALAGIGHSYASLGWFDLSFLWTYAAGQLISGRLADRVPGRIMMVTGLIASAILCSAFSVAGIGAAGLVIWMLHGLAQSLGWSPLLKETRRRVTPGGMTLAMCFIATAYQAGSTAGHAAGGAVLPYWSWRGPFLLPLILYPVVLALCYRWLRTETIQLLPGAYSLSVLRVPRAFWVLSTVLILVNILRYGLLLWLPPLLVGASGLSIRASGFASAEVVGAGIIGTLGAGLLIRGRAIAAVASFSAVLLVMVGGLCCTLTVGRGPGGPPLLALMLIAACLHASHAIVVAVVPAALAPAARAGTVAGTIDAIGYIGTGVAGVLTGYLARAGSWNLILLQWAALAALGSAVAASAAHMLRAGEAASVPAKG